MTSLCIKTNNQTAISYILNSLKVLNFDDIIFSKRQFSKYTNILLHYIGKDINKFYDNISQIISNCIINIYEPQIIKNIIWSEYFYFDVLDSKIIENNCFEILNIKKDNYHHFNSCKNDKNIKKRKKVLKSIVLKYIQLNKTIILDGFVNFRIRDYIEYLNEAVENSVNQFIIDKEYADFIKLIKLYIDSKPALSDTIYLIYDNGNSTLLDKNRNVICCDNTILDSSYLSDISFSSNDYTLNTLLSLLPQNLEINLLSKEDEFINTLKLLFTDRIKINQLENTHNIKGFSN